MEASGFLIAAVFQFALFPIFVATGVARVVALRSVLTGLVLALVVWGIYKAIVLLVGEKSRKLGVWKYWVLAANLLAALILYLLRGPVDTLFAAIGLRMHHWIPAPNWGLFLIGLYDTAIAMLILVSCLQGTGEIFWFVERRVQSWGKREVSEERRTLHEHLKRSLLFFNRVFRLATITVALLLFFRTLFHLFPLTRGPLVAIETYMQEPAAAVGVSVLNYLPNLGYLVVIFLVGWLLLASVHRLFAALKTGRLAIRGFQKEWADTTYRLCRTLLLLFLLMVSFPHLPGASSEFFKGFSVFVGALLTFGSAGAINNLVSGVVLTYTSALHAGDMVRIGDVTGIVIEKTLLVTRVRTPRNEEVSLPNSSVLSSSITNFSARAASGGLGLSMEAGIGYDVDWRTVHALMIDGARKTEHILAEPQPIVLQSALDNYAVNYHLIAWTDRPERMILTVSELRRNVLDCFNAAGVEIMTPSIFAHRDASEPAIPPDRMKQTSVPRRIVVDVHNSSLDIPSPARSGR